MGPRQTKQTDQAPSPTEARPISPKSVLQRSTTGSGRKFYRQSSHDVDGHVHIQEPLENMRRVSSDPGSRQLERDLSGKQLSSMSSRKSMARSMSTRSRITSRAEYHEDLKPTIKQSFNVNLVFSSFIIVFGSSFSFGYNIGVLNQPVELIKDFYNETYTERYGYINENILTFVWSLTTSIYFLGGVAGAFSAGFLADKVGRKKAIIFSQIFAFIGAIISTACTAAKSPELLMIGRIATGVNCGFATVLAPMYLSEFVPFNLRGAFGTCHQLLITVGIFMSSVLGLRELFGTKELWPFLLLLNVIPAMTSVIIVPFLPESPRYLMLTCNKILEAKKSLQFYRKKEDVAGDLDEMETEFQQLNKAEKYTLRQLFASKDLHMPLLVAVMLQLTQQFSGINAIFFYSTGIYDRAGVAKSSIQYAVVGTNAVNVIMTIVAVPLMDIAGRRKLLLFPMAAMLVDLVILTIALCLQEQFKWMSYISVTCIICYVICFAVGLGPIPQMITSELFRQGPRPIAMSIAGLVNWLSTFFVGLCFESIQSLLRDYTFLLFLILLVGFAVFVYLKVPETKNRTFEEIAHDFAPGDEIEVEEMLDDVFDEPETIPEANEHENEDTHLVSINFDKRKSVPDDHSDHDSPSKMKNVTVVLPNGNHNVGKNEERQSLTGRGESHI